MGDIGLKSTICQSIVCLAGGVFVSCELMGKCFVIRCILFCLTIKIVRRFWSQVPLLLFSMEMVWSTHKCGFLVLAQKYQNCRFYFLGSFNFIIVIICNVLNRVFLVKKCEFCQVWKWKMDVKVCSVFYKTDVFSH